MTEDDRIDVADREGAGEHGFHSCLGVPLQIQGRVIGSLNIYAKIRRKFTHEIVAPVRARRPRLGRDH